MFILEVWRGMLWRTRLEAIAGVHKVRPLFEIGDEASDEKYENNKTHENDKKHANDKNNGDDKK